MRKVIGQQSATISFSLTHRVKRIQVLKSVTKSSLLSKLAPVNQASVIQSFLH